MTKDKMINNIRKRLVADYEYKKEDVPKELIAAVLDIFNDEIYTIIALEDSYTMPWAKISGFSKPPTKLAGAHSELEVVIKKGGYSNWKRGYPKCEFSKAARLTDNHHPSEYFAQPSVRYTTAAREYRQTVGLEEIPEFKELSEEKILELNKKADKIFWDSIPYKKRKQMEHDKKYNDIKIKGAHKIWEETGYIPMGSIAGDYKGKQRDTVDYYLESRLKDATNAAQKLDIVRGARDIANYRLTLEKHPELDELEKQFKDEVKKEGLEEIEHITLKQKETDLFNVKLGKEINPWGIIPPSRSLKEKQQIIIDESNNLVAKIIEENRNTDLEKLKKEKETE